MIFQKPKRNNVKLPSDRREALSGRFPRDYFDEELSCYIAEGDAVLGVLLVHRLPSGKIRVERMEGDQKFETER